MYVPQRFITVHLTRACNSRCRFCTTDSIGRRPDIASLEEVEEFLADNQDKGYEAVSVIGGEPTIYPHLEQVLKMITRYGYPMIQMFTNGRRLADADYCRTLVDHGISFYIVSLHDVEPEVHDDLTAAPGSWAEVVSGIRNIKSLGQSVQTMTVIGRGNYRSLPSTAHFLSDLGVDIIDLSAMCPNGLAALNWDQLRIGYDEVLPSLDSAIRACQEVGQEVVLEGFPFCAVSPHERLCVEYPDTRKERMLFHGKLIEDYDQCLNTTSKIRIPRCTECPCGRVCGGVYQGYHLAYGEQGLRTLRSSADNPAELSGTRASASIPTATQEPAHAHPHP